MRIFLVFVCRVLIDFPPRSYLVVFLDDINELALINKSLCNVFLCFSHSSNERFHAIKTKGSSD